MRHQADDRVRARFGRTARQRDSRVHAFFTHIRDDRAIVRHTRRGEAQKFQLLRGVQQRTFAGQRADDETSQRGARPLVEVMLDFDPVQSACVIERRGGRKVDS